MSSAEFKMRGGPELIAMLDQLPKNWANKVVRNAARAGAVVLQKKAKAKLAGHKKTGKLERAVKVSSRIDGDLVIGRVRVKGPHAYIGVFLEYGVRPHMIVVHDEDRPERKTRRGIRKVSIRTVNNMIHTGSLKIGENFVGPFVHHPGHAAFPFMLPALDEGGAEAIGAIGSYIHSHLSWDELKAPRVQVIEDEA